MDPGIGLSLAVEVQYVTARPGLIRPARLDGYVASPAAFNEPVSVQLFPLIHRKRTVLHLVASFAVGFCSCQSYGIPRCIRSLRMGASKPYSMDSKCIRAIGSSITSTCDLSMERCSWSLSNECDTSLR